MKFSARIALLSFLLISTAAQAASTIHKPANLGPFWQPMGNDSATEVYADSFISTEGGSPTSLGTYLRELAADPPNVRFEIWGDMGDGNGPDPSNVIATTGSYDPAVDGTLQFFSTAVSTVNSPMSQGELYWFVITAVGETGANGSYQTGGHTQNSVCFDNGTFWFSNDSAGINFDGQALTPEMAFEVEMNGGGDRACGSLHLVPVPALDPAGLLLLILLAGMSGMVFLRTRTA